ncbi:hypothetical protein [Diplocloster hominis]|uniref:hypothetical protein n=1 Tax=Diplocloster hominis TaxID=3079010 RepID=UPI0031BA3778
MAARKKQNTTYQRRNYIEGNTVRKLEVLPNRQETQAPRKKTGVSTLRNREKALHMNPGYVLFLSVATILVLATCVNYLKLQSTLAGQLNEISSLETQLNTLKAENDAEENRVTASVDLEHVKDVAMNELGMVYATQDQVRLYDDKSSDYVKQYEELPEEENTIKNILKK